MKLINVLAHGYYSNAVKESNYLLSNAFYEFVDQCGVFDSLGASELDGKHSYVEADKTVLEMSELNKLNFTDDYFDDSVFDNIMEAVDYAKEEHEDAEWKEIVSKFTEKERILISEKSTWRDWEEFRKYQVELSESMFEVPQKYKVRIKKLYENNPEGFYEKAWKNGFLR